MMGSSYTDYTYRWKTVHQRGSLVEGTDKSSAEGQPSTASWGREGRSSPSPKLPASLVNSPGTLAVEALPGHSKAMTSLETSYGIYMKVLQTDCTNEMSQKRY